MGDHRRVPAEETLTRAAADLAPGRTGLARQRLRGLTGSFPDRLDLRELLAETYRREGDLAQAGRWSYLAERIAGEPVPGRDPRAPEPALTRRQRIGELLAVVVVLAVLGLALVGLGWLAVTGARTVRGWLT